jgi:hypothetical protein
VALARARDAAAVHVWPLPSLGRALQAPFFGNSVAVRIGTGAVHARMPSMMVCVLRFAFLFLG